MARRRNRRRTRRSRALGTCPCGPVLGADIDYRTRGSGLTLESEYGPVRAFRDRSRASRQRRLLYLAGGAALVGLVGYALYKKLPA